MALEKITLANGKVIHVPTGMDDDTVAEFAIANGLATEQELMAEAQPKQEAAPQQSQSTSQYSPEEIQEGMQLGLALGENGEWVDPTTYAGQMFSPVSNKRVTYNKRHGLKQVDPIQDMPVGPVVINNKLMIVELGANGNKKVRAAQKHEADAYGYKLPGIDDGNKSPAQTYLNKIAEEGEKAVPDYMVGKGTALVGDYLANQFRDKYSNFAGGADEREFYALTRLVDGEGMIKGIEQARAAGASGINTVAEFDMFKQGAPSLDMNAGKENLVSSVKRMKDYITYWNQQKQRELEGTPMFDENYNRIGEFKVEQPATKKEPAKDSPTQTQLKTGSYTSSNGKKYTLTVE